MDYFFLIPAILYIPTIFGLKYLVDNLNKDIKLSINEKLKPYNIMWDLSLSVFSFFGAYYCIAHMYINGYNCSFIENKFWIDMFCYSKVYELIDTVFIVLRGRKLVLLQWYHHLATLILCWAGMELYSKEAILGAAMNYSIHTVMYMYYVLYAIGLKSIRKYGVFITFFQTLQMLIIMYNLVFVSIIPCSDPNKDTSYLYWYSMVIISSYVILFSKLFWDKVIQSVNIKRSE